MGHLWGIDLGGTKIEGAILRDTESTETLCRMRISTEADQGYDHIIARIAELIRMIEQESGETATAIGIGTPGTADPTTGLMKNCNTTALNGKPLPADLTKALNRKVVIANDANCFALAEAKLGAAKGAETVFGVIMGTGVGGGIVINGQVLNGAQGIAGEWGHNMLDPQGEQCYCGKQGCVETVISGPGLERFYAKKSDNPLKLPEILKAARMGHDSAAVETISRLTEKFGEGLSVVINILDPHVIVLGGGVGNVEELYTAGLDSLTRHIFNPELKTKVIKPELGDSAGVFGAAHLVA